MFRPIALFLLAAATPLAAQLPTTSTVFVPGTAALPTPSSSAGATPAVDSGLALSGLAGIQITVRDGQIAGPGIPPNFANGCCFFAEFVDAAGLPVDLDPNTYPARFWPGVPPSMFYPISSAAPALPTLGTVFVSIALPVPGNASGIRYGHFDNGHYNNSGGMDVTTSSAVVVTDLGGGCSLASATITSTAVTLGGTWARSGFDFAPLTWGVLAVSFGAPAPQPFGPCQIHVDLLNPGNVIVMQSLSTDGWGRWDASSGVPNNPAFAGLLMTLQAGVFGTPGPLGIDVSNGLRLQVH